MKVYFNLLTFPCVVRVIPQGQSRRFSERFWWILFECSAWCGRLTANTFKYIVYCLLASKQLRFYVTSKCNEIFNSYELFSIQHYNDINYEHERHLMCKFSMNIHVYFVNSTICARQNILFKHCIFDIVCLFNHCYQNISLSW